ncbi:MAG: amidohydrolase family protein, partial [Firmicutes bacterium]|nr:amidohydrolase family protein [Bacillota bacterium]
KSDVDAIIKGIIDGTIDAIATDHAPHNINDKNVDFNTASFGISGLETAFNISYTNLVKAKHITLEKLNALLSLNPAKILGLNIPEITKGAVADLTIVSIDKENVVDVNGFISKGKNSPFNGFKGYGDILYTIVGGHIKYEKYS